MNNADTRRHGRLKVFLGYAAGVGKTYRMLEEAQLLKQQGVDVVVGYFEPHGRAATIEKAEGLETMPRRKIRYRDISFEEMDTAAILVRRPSVCIVDELAHTNVPGSTRNKRWEDVLVLLDAGIDVFTTVNVQHLESLNDQVWQISGVRVRETLPDWVMKQADEVVMVDATPGALLNRLKRGVVYEPEKARRALENFFKESTLVALRELALRQTAHEVEVRHEELTRGAEHEPEESRSTRTYEHENGKTKDRILIHVTADPATAMLIRRGRRVADYLRADCFAVYVCSQSELAELPTAEREAVQKHLNFARNLHIDARVLQGEDAARTLVDFARRNQVTQVLLARLDDKPWKRLFGTNVISQVVRIAKDMRVTVVAPGHRQQ